MASLIEKMVGSIDDKRRWREYKARVKALPPSYRKTVEALERYLNYYGGIIKGETIMRMLEDLADLFEQGAADKTPIRAIVGEDPVDFVDTFLSNYSEGQWINKERERLVGSIESAEAEQE